MGQIENDDIPGDSCKLELCDSVAHDPRVSSEESYATQSLRESIAQPQLDLPKKVLVPDVSSDLTADVARKVAMFSASAMIS